MKGLLPWCWRRLPLVCLALEDRVDSFTRWSASLVPRLLPSGREVMPRAQASSVWARVIKLHNTRPDGEARGRVYFLLCMGASPR